MRLLVVHEYSAWAQRQRVSGHLIDGEKLNDASLELAGPQGLREIHTEDTSLGGHFVIAAANLDDALAIARTCPHLKHGGTIVIRPIDPTPTNESEAALAAFGGKVELVVRRNPDGQPKPCDCRHGKSSHTYKPPGPDNDPLGVSRREPFWHGAPRLHANPPATPVIQQNNPMTNQQAVSPVTDLIIARLKIT